MGSNSIGCIVPTLNSAETLEATLLSLKSQRGGDVEITVADSGSNDDTLEICRRHGVATVYVEPGNMYRAINAGLLSQGQSEWVSYLNSDDWLYPDSLARLIELGNSSHADVVYGDCDYTDGEGRFVYSFTAARPGRLMPLFRLGRMGFAQPAAIFRWNLYQRLNGFDERYRFKADADFFIRAIKAGAQFAALGGPPVCCFRLHPGQLSNQKRSLIEEEGRLIFGAPEMKPRGMDFIALAQWRLKNLPHFLVRVLRESLLSRRLRFPRSIEEYTHQ
jgi:glycosyltransferase involved in cell wall biosynthesis